MDDLNATFHLTTFDSRVGRMAILTMDNGQDHTRPTIFGAPALGSLHRALDELDRTDDVAGLLLTGKRFVFAVGADTASFVGVDTDVARAGARAGHEAFGRLAALDVPTVAAINGAAMGGGLEIALHCDHRTLSTGASALAFPEVFLSILPGWGGTQLAPRLVGGPGAIQSIVIDPLNANTVMRPRTAFERGFADRLIDSASFLDDSIVFLEGVVAGDVVVDRQVDPTEGLDEALTDARAFVEAKVHGATAAPSMALDLVEHAARGGAPDEGRRREQDALAELLPARQAQASIYAFDLVQRRVRTQPGKPAARGRRITRVGVIGAGLMGAQLGALFLQRLEVPLVMKDIDVEVLDGARQHIEAALDDRVAKRRLAPGRAEFLKGLVTYTTDDADLAGVDWVIEAVLERLDLKQSILADVEEVVADDAILATNTSSLSVAEIASGLARPERVVGFHFFNPVAVLPLVEVIHHDHVSDVALATAYEVAATLRKSAVGCDDAPAFIVNRLLTRFNNAATAALATGASFRDIDEAVMGLGLPMGPFALMGLVGVQVAHHTAETLEAAFGERFAISDNFHAIATIDPPGGVYDRSAGGTVRPEVADAITVDPDTTPATADEIRLAALEAVADEIHRMLDDGVVTDARDIDTALILGAGFPFFTGGIALLLDQVGVSQRLFGAPLVTPHDRAR